MRHIPKNRICCWLFTFFAGILLTGGVCIRETVYVWGEQPETETEIETETVLPIEEEFFYSAAETSAVAETYLGSSVSLSAGQYQRFIDRVALSDYAKRFYQTLEKNASGTNSFLINPANGSRLPDGSCVVNVVTFTGSRTMNEKEVADEIIAAYNAFDRDHPEVFWLNGSCIVTYSVNKKKNVYEQTFYFVLKNATFDVRDTTTYPSANRILNAISERDGNINKILDGMNADADRAGKATYFNYWLTSHNQYNTIVGIGLIGWAPNTAWECVSALEGNSGGAGPVCEGYARAFKVLCDRAGIPCVLVDGDAGLSPATAGPHMWNYVELENGSWYAVDVTWNDQADLFGESDGTDDYLLVGADTVINEVPFLTSHPESNTVSSDGVAFGNGPQLSEQAYAAGTIHSLRISVSGSAAYGYRSGPVLTAQAYGVDGKALTGLTYAWKIDGTAYSAEDAAGRLTFPVGKNAGTYRCVLTATAAEGYVAQKSTDITIAQADPVYAVPAGLTATYGSTLGNVVLPGAVAGNTPGSFRWENPGSAVGNVGTVWHKAVFTPVDTVNYRVIRGIDVAVEVRPCTHPAVVLRNERAAGCTEDGYTGDQVCSFCGTVVHTGKSIPAVGHSYVAAVTKEPTYREEGLMTYTCSRCGTVYSSAIERLPAQGIWMLDGVGWWFLKNDGTYPRNGWSLVEDKWYVFDAQGYMRTGWYQSNGLWYYLGYEGAMESGWVYDRGSWYYLEADGVMQTGWHQIDGEWYYFDRGGAMAVGWRQTGGRWYYLGASGAMVTGWQRVGGSWYYFFADGGMAANTNVDGYHLGADGAMW